MKKAITLIVSGILFSSIATGIPTVIFSESFGTGDSTTISSHSGFDNSSPIVFSGTGEIKDTTNSSGYPGATGDSNAFFSNSGGKTLEVSGISTVGFVPGSLQLSFGTYRFSTGSLTNMTVSFSTDGLAFTALSFVDPGDQWNLAVITNPVLLPSTSNLWLKWENFDGPNSNDQFRVDDITLKGERAAVPESGTTLTFLGLAAFGLILFRRFQT